MLELSELDLDEIATALADQEDYEHRWLVDPRTGEIAFWSRDSGLDGEPVDLDEVDLIGIDPLPSWVWYRDLVDFADQVSDDRARRRLGRALDGRGAFRRFKAELQQGWPELVPAWYAFCDTRAARRAVEWLQDNGLVSDEQATAYLDSLPDPPIP
ncbi:MAG: UPF0158 family protein [Acidimicrobiia bacterium]|nr:UPF0158 family protein [Acidimicrobiia bacterium]